ncbi:MAG: D-lyxose/D-mannose family sugar isomerase [Parabacteroides distasonis]
MGIFIVTKKSYCEKIMMVREGQVTPVHFHWKKMEDIINRGACYIVYALMESDGDGRIIYRRLLCKYRWC